MCKSYSISGPICAFMILLQQATHMEVIHLSTRHSVKILQYSELRQVVGELRRHTAHTVQIG